MYILPADITMEHCYVIPFPELLPCIIAFIRMIEVNYTNAVNYVVSSLTTFYPANPACASLPQIWGQSQALKLPPSLCGETAWE